MQYFVVYGFQTVFMNGRKVVYLVDIALEYMSAAVLRKEAAFVLCLMNRATCEW